jgi:ribosomal protein S18 acetylase RimI-like enzyme
MSEPMELCLNKASSAEIAHHLRCCDSDFVPPLSNRVEIDSYAQKIVNNALRFEAWDNDMLVGLVAAYCNDSARHIAYITNVSVLHERLGQGIATQLMSLCVEHIAELGFERIELEVDSANSKAIKLYEKNGFITDGVRDQATLMHINIGKDID